MLLEYFSQYYVLFNITNKTCLSTLMLNGPFNYLLFIFFNTLLSVASKLPSNSWSFPHLLCWWQKIFIFDLVKSEPFNRNYNYAVIHLEIILHLHPLSSCLLSQETSSDPAVHSCCHHVCLICSFGMTWYISKIFWAFWNRWTCFQRYAYQ